LQATLLDVLIDGFEKNEVLRVRAPLFATWWHDPNVWQGHPFGAMFRWLAEERESESS